ncbi:hypothetical protein HNR46_002356 [Haloferula luteola]|uniref:FG-GAP repeat protein n=1 Tax=Haloferula luteola TaxID=595692 RepID=A0A840V2A3_9BACT|nr:FG-GAP-like repeat-containing protein [Haloferula luteola]MBB5352115.1 hypothetical protein [Haloferula luteola]
MSSVRSLPSSASLGSLAALMMGLFSPLGQAATLSGKATRADNGSPLAGVSIYLLSWVEEDESWDFTFAPVTSDAQGDFRLEGIPAGEFRLAFILEEDAEWTPCYWGGGLDDQNSLPVIVSEGSSEISGIHQALQRSRLESYAISKDDGSHFQFFGNVLVPYQLESSTNLLDWKPVGDPEFPGDDGRISWAPPALDSPTQAFWRVAGPKNLQLAPDPHVDATSSYTRWSQDYRWENRDEVWYPYSSGGNFLHAFGYGDFNGDGELDYLAFPGTGLSTEETPGILRLSIDTASSADGASIFHDGMPGSTHARKLLIGDLNGDGVDDAVIIDHGYDADPFPGAPLKVLLSDGEGGISVETYPEWTAFHHGGCLGDVDGDGDLDLFLANTPWQGLRHFIALNDGQGHFSISRQVVGLPWDENIWTSEFFDLDGDGYLDLAFGGDTQATGGIIAWGNPRGTYGAERLILPFAEDLAIYDMDAEDLDGDGDRDLLVTLADSLNDRAELRLFINHGHREFVDETEQRFASSSYSVHWIDYLFVRDLDGDEDLDLAADVRGALIYWENEGDGHFGTSQTY